MAVGDVTMPHMHVVKGVKIGSTQAYVRYPNRRDLVVFEFVEGSQVAGVFTQSAFAAAPVLLSKKHLNESSAVQQPRYLIINTGNANAATGKLGLENATKTCAKLAELAHVQPHQVLPFSTGVIGEQLPIERLLNGIQPALDTLDEASWTDAAFGIMTTDTVPKGASEQFELDGITYTMTGISKGAGMIRPNMATMLSFVATDAPISQAMVQQLLQTTVEHSFNRITIDGDTSTNDSCIFVATAQAGGNVIESSTDPRYTVVLDVLTLIMNRLAQLIVRDGEGATKFITVTVEGGANTQECCDVAYSISDSPLIKTALFASDPNWGRIVMAIGKAGIQNLDSSKVQVWLGDVQICLDGGANPDYTEEMGAAVMAEKEITIRVDLGRGQAKDTVYTCDLSYDYVKINADYRS
ncbi:MULTISPECIES: bifunctional glutamate N-acetyltransferase/amino-acid acetyltransferase ArgJ [Acinetobacter]|uniref:bifunctional glutamate N-acetyltransferase/amino-acid acetyltransferase ArgJ n=1 Tax=Acinetobacter TaxID=469 RepID=UPI000552A02E|nr:MULTISPECIES: bifunctional glutamate N-acetyltransferase/amino-acid acetyltransferase ArgJ [Acinetobacter]ECE6726268.1 bifunctional glutamate N-acetyltransferase/amino-acid acetyltransferase ArgJ [Salmonella enterica subsp. enterica serovar Paratyphi A]MCH2016240.1 bifunctional glutamate N-acetyltransferase/amino-acid acetyltransferase ArgJ [Acinetobacter ursingii]MCU4522986.1 bifunctional glutamate N-acetyltransferase/amino-acid acetyltransferase ArgJ [Acinetobacter ursingii]MCU4588747.1 bi